MVLSSWTRFWCMRYWLHVCKCKSLHMQLMVHSILLQSLDIYPASAQRLPSIWDRPTCPSEDIVRFKD